MITTNDMRRFILYTTLGALLGAMLLACGRQKTEEGNTLQVVLLRGPSAIALANWLEHPPRIDGRQVEARILDSPDLAQAALIKGAAQVALLPMVSAANLYNKGLAIHLAGCPVWGTLYLVERETVANPALFLFGQGTTPDLLARHHLRERGLDYPVSYLFRTAGEVARGLLAGKVDRAVLSEPFLSVALRRDSTLRIVADLNRTGNADSIGFPQTAIVYTPTLERANPALERELAAACAYADQHPDSLIRLMEAHGLFPKGALDKGSIERCRIRFLPASTIQSSVNDFLRLIEREEPKAIGGRLPDTGFFHSTHPAP